jgi:hypothetical protein
VPIAPAPAQALTRPPCRAAGLPANNDLTLCSTSTQSCYFFYKAKKLTYAGAKATCAKMGGYLVAYNR